MIQNFKATKESTVKASLLPLFWRQLVLPVPRGSLVSKLRIHLVTRVLSQEMNFS